MDFTSTFWDKTYRRNISKLTGVCYRYVADRQLAEDLAHDAFMQAMEKSGSFRGTGEFDAWLRRITVNVALSHIRKSNAKQLYDDILTNDDTMDDVDNKNIIAQVDFSEDELLAAINTLPEHHRLVVNMYVIDGYTHAQIAAELGISEGTSKSHLARARKKLQQHLTEIAQTKQKRRRAWLILLFMPGRSSIDGIYQYVFSSYSLPAIAGGSAGQLATQASTATMHTVGQISIAAPVAAKCAAGAIVAGGLVAGGAIVTNNFSQNNEPAAAIIVVSDSIPAITADTLPVADTLLQMQPDTEPKSEPQKQNVVVKKKKIIHRRSVVVRDTIQTNKE